MKLSLSQYSKLKICVAVSGGKDSVALLYYLCAHAKEYSITLSALNCDHSLRGEASVSDSEFVKRLCEKLGVPLTSFKRNENSHLSENEARIWRLACYKKAIEGGADAIATAHHANDNAETVLFNLARGCSLSGAEGITDCVVDGVKLIRPLINCTREEIDEYIKENNLSFVTDESNFSLDYTRNKIRLNVLPMLENAVQGAIDGISRFSRLAKEDDDFLFSEMRKRNILTVKGNTAFIKTCDIKPLFSRAVCEAVKNYFNLKDYTASHVESLFKLQNLSVGKRFEFLGLTAYKEDGAIAVCRSNCLPEAIIFNDYKDKFFGETELEFGDKEGTLKFDADKIPSAAVIRTFLKGDRFKKFGGGEKSLGDYFTDKKIPVRLRNTIPLIADGREILAVCGVEISDLIKVDDNTKSVKYINCKLNFFEE